MFETASAPDGAASSGAVAFRECWSSAACNQKAQTSWFRQVAHLPSNKAILSETSMAVSKLTVDSAEWADIVRAMKAKAIAATVFIVPYFLLLSCLTRMQIAQLKCQFNILFKIYVKKIQLSRICEQRHGCAAWPRRVDAKHNESPCG